MVCSFVLAAAAAAATLACLSAAAAATGELLPSSSETPLSFGDGYTQLFGDSNLALHGGGKRVHISLDERTGAGFASQAAYLHGHFSARVKLPADHTAGVVVAFYMSNGDVYERTHDELDFEFLGNVRGKEWRVQTNVYGNGSTAAGREERYGLWFDPTEDFHRYAIHWTRDRIIFYIDDTPIREMVRAESMGAQFPSKPMSLYATIWDGSSWATSGGRYKVDYKYAPYVAEFADLALRGRPRRGVRDAWRRRRRVRPRRCRDAARAAFGDGGVPGALHDVRLLLRPPPVPRAAAGVQRRRGGRGVPPVGGRAGGVA